VGTSRVTCATKPHSRFVLMVHGDQQEPEVWVVGRGSWSWALSTVFLLVENPNSYKYTALPRGPSPSQAMEVDELDFLSSSTLHRYVAGRGGLASAVNAPATRTAVWQGTSAGRSTRVSQCGRHHRAHATAHTLEDRDTRIWGWRSVVAGEAEEAGCRLGAPTAR
jgi:hypothetical protein